MRGNWTHGQHPPACTCVQCQNRSRGQEAVQRSQSGGRNEASIQRGCETYIAGMCKKFNIRQPLLVIDDTMYNPGACGEAGKLVIRVQRHFILTANRQNREAVLRHELAHIAVHNTPGLGDVEAHGPEFKRELDRLGGDRMTGSLGSVGSAGTIRTPLPPVAEGNEGAADGPTIRQVLGVIIILLAASVLFQGWFMPVLPDWLAQYIAPVLVPAADFVWTAYWQWPVWTILAGAVLVLVVTGLVAGVEKAAVLFMFYGALGLFVVSLIVSISWVSGDGLLPWAASVLVPLGVPLVAPDNWIGFTRVMVVIGSVVGTFLVAGIVAYASAWVLDLLWRAISWPFSRGAAKDGTAPTAKYWRGGRINWSGNLLRNNQDRGRCTSRSNHLGHRRSCRVGAWTDNGFLGH